MWVPRGVDDKIGYLCIKDLETEKEDTVSPGFHNRLPMRGPFRPLLASVHDSDSELSSEDPIYTKTDKKCKEVWKNSRFYDDNRCMKYFPQKVSFQTAWKKCQERG